MLAIHPDSGMLYEQYGDVLALAGDIGKAEDSYRKAMNLQPNLTGITLKIQALESTKKKTPLGFPPVALALCIGLLLLFRRKGN